MISVNLLPREDRIETHALARPRAKFLLPLAVVVALIVPLGVLFFHQEVKLQALRREIRVAEQESATLQQRVALVRELTQTRAELVSRLQLVQRLNQERATAVRLMDVLAAQIPSHLWLTHMQQNGPGSVTLEGVTFSNLIVAELLARLEASGVYRDVELSIAERGQIGESKVMKFALRAATGPKPAQESVDESAE